MSWGDCTEGRTTLADLDNFIAEPIKNQKAIAAFVYWRLYERYIKPFEELKQINFGQTEEPSEEEVTTGQNKLRIGFAVMANMCLLIETLEAFKKGVNRFYGRKKEKISYEDAFVDFFKEYGDKFGVGKDFGKTFYSDIRCAILHQGETYGGWLINNGAKAIDEEGKVINAKVFMETMKDVLTDYRRSIEISDGSKGSVLSLCKNKMECLKNNVERK